jgi:hypothetical protein
MELFQSRPLNPNQISLEKRIPLVDDATYFSVLLQKYYFTTTE